MYKLFYLVLAVFLLAACGSKQEPLAMTTAVSTQPSLLKITTTPPTARQETAVSTPPTLVQITALPTLAQAETAVPPATALVPTATPAPTATHTPTPTATPAYPIYDGPPLNRSDIGIQLHIQQVDLFPLMNQAQALDVGWVKTQVSWKLYQPYPDHYSDERLAELDAFVEAANARGLAVMLNVAKAPEWSRATTELDGPPLDYDLFRQFMQFLAERYQGRVVAYELWNESNLQREWNGSPLSAADSVALMQAGAAGVRAGDPDALLISGAPATTGINDSVAAIDDRVYLRAMLAAGVGDVVDGIGVHPYGAGNPPESSVYDSLSTSSGQAPSTGSTSTGSTSTGSTSTGSTSTGSTSTGSTSTGSTSTGSVGVSSHNNHASFFFKDTLDDYAALLAEYGVAKPLWATEFGWGSFDGIVDKQGTPAPPPTGAEFMGYVDEWQQAVYILGAYEIAHNRDEVGPLMLWNLNFGSILGTQFAESGYSVLRLDGSLRPSYLALQHAEKQKD